MYNVSMNNPLQIQKYENKWVAVKEDQTKIVASADSLKKLNKMLDKLGDKKSVITYIPRTDSFLSPYGLL